MYAIVTQQWHLLACRVFPISGSSWLVSMLRLFSYHRTLRQQSFPNYTSCSWRGSLTWKEVKVNWMYQGLGLWSSRNYFLSRSEQLFHGTEEVNMDQRAVGGLLHLHAAPACLDREDIDVPLWHFRRFHKYNDFIPLYERHVVYNVQLVIMEKDMIKEQTFWANRDWEFEHLLMLCLWKSELCNLLNACLQKKKYIYIYR